MVVGYGKTMNIQIYVIRGLPDAAWGVIAEDPEGIVPMFQKNYYEIEIRVPCKTKIIDKNPLGNGRYVMTCQGCIEEHPGGEPRAIIRASGLPAKW